MQLISNPTMMELSDQSVFLSNSTWNFSKLHPFNVTDEEILKILDDYRKSQFTLAEAKTIVLITLYVPIFLTALIGNLLVLLVIVPNQRMWSVTNNFLVNLAVTDLLVTLICIPMTVATRVYKLWVFGETLCKLTPYLQGVSVTVSTFTITAMSIDRCLAILHPMKFRHFRTTKCVRILIMFVWVAAILLILPLLFVRQISRMEIFAGEVFTHCTEFWDSPLARRTYDFAILFIICVFPAVIVLISYALMGKRLWETDEQLRGGKGNNSSMNGSIEDKKGRRDGGVIANRRRLAKMCITVSVVFILCWTPYYTMNIYLDYQHDVDTADMLHYTLLIGHLHCITNPIMYCFLHKTFRHYVERYLSCGKKIRNPFATAGAFTSDRASKLWHSFRSTARRSSRRSPRKSTSPTHSTWNSHTPKTNRQDMREHECSSDSYTENVPLNRSHKNTEGKRVRLIFKKTDGQKTKYPASLRVVQIPDMIKEESKTNSI